ncbi:MAG: phosphoribosylformylglycinamidine cyclo-ligase [bacterium]|nr:phosphoribosylformylglycinamidine cyclo-ligase [bacterium]
MDYRQAGVDVNAAERLVDRIKELVKRTQRPGVVGGIGLFGGLFDLQAANASRRLVASTDGVGTKTIIASWANRFDTIGECLINHCVNDIAVLGAEPLFVLDTLATDRLVPERDTQILEGIVRGCERNGIGLIGGETAELKDVIMPGQFDLGVTIIGYLPDDVPLLDGSRIEEGDELWGISSTGLHTNGYTLARKVLLEQERLAPDEKMPNTNVTYSEALLAIHRSYLPEIRALRAFPEVHGFAHITGGGIVGNTKRLIKNSLSLEINWNSWQEPRIFQEIRTRGNVPEEAMRQAMNLGIGLVVIAKKDSKRRLQSEIPEVLFRIGKVIRS